MEWSRYNNRQGRDDAKLWDEDPQDRQGFNRGDKSWWREQYYEYEVHIACVRALGPLEVILSPA